MCGDRRVVEGVKTEDLFGSDETEDGTDQADYGSLGRSKGREVVDVPLCAKCVEEISRDKLDEEHLIPMALGRVDRFDGGLSRRRWEARQQTERLAATVASHALEETVADARRPPSPIYVSIHDPTGAPSFKGSPTKPIPKWMQYLPSQKHQTRVHSEPRPSSIIDPHFSPPAAPATSDGDEADSAPPSPVPSHMDPVAPPVPPHTVPVRPRSTVPTYMPVQMSRPFTFIAEEPVQRPSSAKATLGRSTQGKQVRFTNIPQVHSPLAAPPAGDRAKRPSESAEYLERYRVRSPIDARSSTAHIPSSFDGRAAGMASPCNKRATCAAHYSPAYAPHYASMSAASTVNGIREESGSSSRTVDHKDYVYRGYEAYSQSPGSSVQGGEGSVEGPCGRRRPFTFQDQLKRVFGFN